jgi:Holliday junction resolvasome RuvABC endonuclease subunit
MAGLVVLALDPGLRNLGAVIVGVKDKKVTLVFSGVFHVAYQKEAQAQKVQALAMVVKMIPGIEHTDLLVVENQNFGKYRSTPDNLGLQWGLAAAVIANANGKKPVALEFQDSKHKSAVFKKFEFTRAEGGRNATKNFSMGLARWLCCKVFKFNESAENKKLYTVDHLADAFGMAITTLYEKGKLDDYFRDMPLLEKVKRTKKRIKTEVAEETVMV